MSKPGYATVSLLLACMGAACQRPADPPPGPREIGGPSLPNILFILADDVGYGDPAVYGGRIPTPNIDALALAGMRFTDAHSPAALCAPSRFSLLTGSYPYRNGRAGGTWDIDNSSGFDAGSDHLIAGRHVTVGEILQRSGYRTGFVGKLHLGGDVFDSSGRVIREKKRLNEMDFARGVRNGVNARGFDYSFGLQSGIQHEPYAYFEPGQRSRVRRLHETFLRHNDHDNGTFIEPRTTPAFVPAASN